MVKKIKKRTKKERATSAKLQTNLQFSKAHLVETELIFEECMEAYHKTFVYDAPKKSGEETTSVKVPAPDDGEPKDREREDVSLPEDEDIRKIFKMIALKTHPDKLRGVDPEEAEELTELYKDAAEAAGLSDGGELLLIAARLKIDTGIEFNKEVEWSTEKITKLRQHAGNIAKTDAWLWFHSEGKQREEIEKFIRERMPS